MEALRKLQKKSESLPVHSEAKVLSYTKVNPEKLMEYVPSETADGDGFSEFAEGCQGFPFRFLIGGGGPSPKRGGIARGAVTTYKFN